MGRGHNGSGKGPPVRSMKHRMLLDQGSGLSQGHCAVTLSAEKAASRHSFISSMLGGRDDAGRDSPLTTLRFDILSDEA